MPYFDSIEKALKYIEDNLTNEIDMVNVANVTGYSPYHFQRIFKAAVGDSIMEYTRKRRVTEAAKEMYHTNQPIVDIAIKYGYQSREAFSRAFEKVYGRNPSQVKKEGLLYFLREPMTKEYMRYEYKRRKEGLQPSFKELPERYVVGKQYKVTADGSNLQDIPLYWQKWHQFKEWKKITTRKNEECMGICILTQGLEFTYMIGHEVSSLDPIPNDMVAYKLEPTSYAVFHTIGPITESVQKAWDYIYSIWFVENDYVHTGTHDIELYYEEEGKLVADLYVPIKEKSHN